MFIDEGLALALANLKKTTDNYFFRPQLHNASAANVCRLYPPQMKGAGKLFP